MAFARGEIRTEQWVIYNCGQKMNWILQIAFFVLMLGFVINGSFMLFSPSRWDKLPWWIRGLSKGSPVGMNGGGPFIRIFGAVFLLFTAVFICAYFRHR